MTEYSYDAEDLENLEVREGNNIIGYRYMEEDPVFGEIYDFGFDGIFIYLEKRDDAKAKQIIVDDYTNRLNKAKQLKIIEK